MITGYRRINAAIVLVIIVGARLLFGYSVVKFPSKSVLVVGIRILFECQWEIILQSNSKCLTLDTSADVATAVQTTERLLFRCCTSTLDIAKIHAMICGT